MHSELINQVNLQMFFGRQKVANYGKTFCQARNCLLRLVKINFPPTPLLCIGNIMNITT